MPEGNSRERIMGVGTENIKPTPGVEARLGNEALTSTKVPNEPLSPGKMHNAEGGFMPVMDASPERIRFVADLGSAEGTMASGVISDLLIGGSMEDRNREVLASPNQGWLKKFHKLEKVLPVVALFTLGSAVAGCAAGSLPADLASIGIGAERDAIKRGTIDPAVRESNIGLRGASQVLQNELQGRANMADVRDRTEVYRIRQEALAESRRTQLKNELDAGRITTEEYKKQMTDVNLRLAGSMADITAQSIMNSADVAYSTGRYRRQAVTNAAKDEVRSQEQAATDTNRIWGNAADRAIDRGAQSLNDMVRKALD